MVYVWVLHFCFVLCCCFSCVGDVVLSSLQEMLASRVCCAITTCIPYNRTIFAAVWCWKCDEMSIWFAFWYVNAIFWSCARLLIKHVQIKWAEFQLINEARIFYVDFCAIFLLGNEIYIWIPTKWPYEEWRKSNWPSNVALSANHNQTSQYQTLRIKHRE